MRASIHWRSQGVRGSVARAEGLLGTTARRDHRAARTWEPAIPEAREMLRAAGFVEAEFVGFTGYKTAATTIGAAFRARRS